MVVILYNGLCVCDRVIHPSIHQCISPASAIFVHYAEESMRFHLVLIPTISLERAQVTCSFTIPSLKSSSRGFIDLDEEEEEGGKRDCLPDWLEFRSWWTIYLYGASFRNSAKSRPLNCSFIGSKRLQRRRCDVKYRIHFQKQPFSFAIVGHMCLPLIAEEQMDAARICS